MVSQGVLLRFDDCTYLSRLLELFLRCSQMMAETLQLLLLLFHSISNLIKQILFLHVVFCCSIPSFTDGLSRGKDTVLDMAFDIEV